MNFVIHLLLLMCLVCRCLQKVLYSGSDNCRVKSVLCLQKKMYGKSTVFVLVELVFSYHFQDIYLITLSREVNIVLVCENSEKYISFQKVLCE